MLLLFLFYGNLRGSISIFLERSILISVVLVAVVQVIDESTAQHSLSLTVDEHYLLSFLVLVGSKYLAEL